MHYIAFCDKIHAQFHAHFSVFGSPLTVMATFKIYPDFRRQKKDGTSQVKLVLNYGGSQRYISLGMYVSSSDWDSNTGMVTDGNQMHRQINLRIDQIRVAVEEILLFSQSLVPIDEIIQQITNRLFPERQKQNKERKKLTLLEVAGRCASLKSEKSTRLTYERTVKHIELFEAKKNKKTFLDDVNQTWLHDFDANMALLAPSPNARALHMRNLRAVFNYAIDEELTKNYPFRKYKIKTVETAKRNLGVEQLRKLLTMEVEVWQQPYRDFFALSFYLIGMNAKDILYLPSMADSSGRINFNRSKTKKLYSIRVEDEAREIIERNRGENYMLNIMDGRSDYLQYIRQCNHALQMIGTHSTKGCKATGKALFPGVTTYWARHSWATIASDLDVPKETIAAALGHDMGNRTSTIYIDYNQRKVDEANKRVIDYVLYGKK